MRNAVARDWDKWAVLAIMIALAVFMKDMYTDINAKADASCVDGVKERLSRMEGKLDVILVIYGVDPDEIQMEIGP